VKLLVLPGDGIGPEITAATLDVLTAADEQCGLGLEFETRDIGWASLATAGTTLPQAVVERVPQVDGVLLGPVSHYEYPGRAEGGVNPSAELRTAFELFANVRPCRSRPGLSVLRHPMDLVIVRENTEGFYSDRNMHAGTGEFMPDPDLAISLRKISARSCERVARKAFELAERRRRKVTAVHKANVVKLSDGLFLREVRRVAADFPDVELEELIVDAAAALLVRRPQEFDVVVTTNMFGDILSDEASELSGGLGLGGSINEGHDVCVAQAQHGSAPDIAGRGVANPTSLILSAAMLLDWRGRRDGAPALVAAAEAITRAVDATLDDPATRTRDLGGTLGTAAFADAVRRNLAQPGGSSRSHFPSSVLRPGELTAFSRGGGARTVPLVTRARGATVFLSGQTLFEGGAEIPLHVHNCPESVVVLEGDAVAEIDGREHALTTFDTTYVDAGVPHRFRNASDTAPMRILWTYASVDATRTLVATGATTRVDAEHETS
jgi:3-isopropylmalate dehydrogenase